LITQLVAILEVPASVQRTAQCHLVGEVLDGTFTAKILERREQTHHRLLGHVFRVWVSHSQDFSDCSQHRTTQIHDQLADRCRFALRRTKSEDPQRVLGSPGRWDRRFRVGLRTAHELEVSQYCYSGK
jgi:hypothetical protein